MRKDQWEEIKDVFHRIREEPSRREELLASLETESRAELESLLANDSSETMGSLFSGMAAGLLADDVSRLPVNVGAYRIERVLGSGGMGTVYLASRSDASFSKLVAIKLIAVTGASDELRRRFRLERQILATLEHPNIARLLDGGSTTGGLPYVVMEYVEGEPIDAYCDRLELTIPERLELFRQVCAAVAYAHRHLIVHRDLKPGNILVTTDGTPKLLDFGISKIIGEAGAADDTATENRVMTLAYASPEQLNGAPIATTTDVYSLGVILYRLLTGLPPYEIEPSRPHDAARAIRDTEPRRPSAAARLAGASARKERALRGDLDNIVLRAMHKVPDRRYASVEQLSSDIERHLSGRPVSARPDSAGYRASKFVRRNRFGVIAAAIILLTLIGGIATTSWQATQAKRAQAKSDQRFNDLRKLAHTLVFDIEEEVGEVTGGTKARELIVNTAVQYLDALAAEADDPSLQIETAEGLVKIGDVQGNPYASNLGQAKKAIVTYRKAINLMEGVLASRPRDAKALDTLIPAYIGLADVQAEQGELRQAAAAYREGMARYDRLAAIKPLDVTQARRQALLHGKLGDILGHPSYANLGDLPGALREHNTALALREALYASHPANDRVARDVQESYTKLALMRSAMGDPATSIAASRKALAICETLANRQPDVANTQSDLAFAYLTISFALRETGQQPEAIQFSEKSAAVMQRLVTTDPDSRLWQRNLGVIYHHTAQAYQEIGNHAAAVDACTRSIAIAQPLHGLDPNDDTAAMDLALPLRKRGESLHALKRHAEAEASFRAAIALLANVNSENPSNRFERAIVEERLGVLLLQSSHPGGLTMMQHARDELERLVSAAPGNAKMRDELATVELDLGSALAERDPAEACQHVQRALGIWQEMRASHTLRWRGAQLSPQAAQRSLAHCQTGGSRSNHGSAIDAARSGQPLT